MNDTEMTQLTLFFLRDSDCRIFDRNLVYSTVKQCQIYQILNAIKLLSESVGKKFNIDNIEQISEKLDKILESLNQQP